MRSSQLRIRVRAIIAEVPTRAYRADRPENGAELVGRDADHLAERTAQIEAHAGQWEGGPLIAERRTLPCSFEVVAFSTSWARRGRRDLLSLLDP